MGFAKAAECKGYQIHPPLSITVPLVPVPAPLRQSQHLLSSPVGLSGTNRHKDLMCDHFHLFFFFSLA